MLVEDARKELKQWLDDLGALRPWIDAGNPDAKPFADAFAAARARALAAASAYAEAVSRENDP